MVNKIGGLLEKLGKEDLHRRYSFLSDTKGIDNLAVTSDPDKELFREFEQVAFDNYSDNDLIGIYADKAYSEMIEESDKIHSNAVNYFTYENGSPTTQMADLLATSKNEKSMIIASKEYIDEFREKVDLEKQADQFISLYK